LQTDKSVKARYAIRVILSKYKQGKRSAPLVVGKNVAIPGLGTFHADGRKNFIPKTLKEKIWQRQVR